MLQRDIFDFNKGILDEAKAVRARNEVKAEWAWWISVGLFVIGWFIGLLGTIYGHPNPWRESGIDNGSGFDVSSTP